jgi:DMSO/TMAO reductase YedYZ molybdopterin-dependent catalytic subunit
MSRNSNPHRRNVLRATLGAGAALTVGACQPVSDKGWVRSILGLGEAINFRVQRAILGDALAPEFAEADISPIFKPNGSTDPADEDYKALAVEKFASYRLVIDGLVDNKTELSLQELRAMPARTQITKHDCVEGWTAIGKWKGVPLAAVLDRAGVKPQARYVVFHCFDLMGESEDSRYYESIDMVDARHPQTILAYEMNGQTLPVAHGAPLRVRVERQLGYKMAKYTMRIELVEDFDRGYDWFAGI